jgi:hypothetical protein
MLMAGLCLGSVLVAAPAQATQAHVQDTNWPCSGC